MGGGGGGRGRQCVAVLSCVHTMTRLPVPRIFNVRSNVDARDCTP